MRYAQIRDDDTVICHLKLFRLPRNGHWTGSQFFNFLNKRTKNYPIAGVIRDGLFYNVEQEYDNKATLGSRIALT